MKLLILSLFICSSASFSQQWITECINLTINTKFSQAESLLTARIADGDSSMEVFFYYASVLNSKMTHFENNASQKEFYQALNQVIQKGEQLLDGKISGNHEKAQILFYVGSAYGYLGFFQGQIGEWFSAVRNGSRAHHFLQQAVAADSTIWDAYLGLGAYKYWLSTKIHWIPLIPDEREKGIALIKKSIRHNPHSRYMAMHQLIYILLDYGDYNQAEIVAREVIKIFPQSQFMYWAYSHVYMKKKDYPNAIEAYKTLLQLIEADDNANPNHRITCLARLGDMYARSGDCRQAKKVRSKIIQDDYNKTRPVNSEIDELLERMAYLCGL